MVAYNWQKLQKCLDRTEIWQPKNEKFIKKKKNIIFKIKILFWNMLYLWRPNPKKKKKSIWFMLKFINVTKTLLLAGWLPFEDYLFLYAGLV